jgi:hypothetical protein
MLRKKSLIVILIWLQVLLMLFVSTVSGGLGVKGVTIEADVAPGEHFSQDIIVYITETDPPMDIKAEVMGFGQPPGGGTLEILLEKDSGDYTARPFLKVTPASFHLEPGQEQILTVQGNIPSDVGAGGRYAIVNIHTKPIGNGTVGISLAINIPVRLGIVGTEWIMTGEIESIKLDEPVSPIQQNVTLAFKNTGNYHYQVKMDATMSNEEGTVLATASQPVSYSPVLPTSSRVLDFSFLPDQALAPGNYSIHASVALEDGAPLASKEISFKV